ncbi:hypothetical protein GCM10009687_25570 [Asanoa iriomotensis]|uniref:Uncharacterized protein n=1 Tax=Asanoa iriomotensis TaxID=234613 RepID=A0ABQ4CHE6_9ACTN|nr:hypothetical protein Air01nite_78300 [Asanoa iriomotensis]
MFLRLGVHEDDHGREERHQHGDQAGTENQPPDPLHTPQPRREPAVISSFEGDGNRRPVIQVDDRRLTLGLDSAGTWIVWSPTQPVQPAEDRLLWLLPLLERPPDEVIAALAEAGADESLIPALLRCALESWSGYWAGLALGWLETGYPATDLTASLATLKDSPTQPQSVRHRALRLWTRNVARRRTPPRSSR